jgi:hypothetical protein
MALATASARPRAVSSTAPPRGGGDSSAALAFLSRFEILRRHLPHHVALGCHARRMRSHLSGSWTRAPGSRALLELHSSVPAPKHSGEVVALCRRDVKKLKWPELDEEVATRRWEGARTGSLISSARAERRGRRAVRLGGEEDAAVAAVVTQRQAPPSSRPRRKRTANSWQRVLVGRGQPNWNGI